jgi:hypothetical protein
MKENKRGLKKKNNNMNRNKESYQEEYQRSEAMPKQGAGSQPRIGWE